MNVNIGQLVVFRSNSGIMRGKVYYIDRNNEFISINCGEEGKWLAAQSEIFPQNAIKIENEESF